jgi:ral guanine nucleotide dissociation stimulator-like 1
MGDEQMPKSSSAQYLGEVQEDDIIYSLNLRKVFVDVDETQENRRLWTTEIEKTIHSGSVGSLVQHLAPLGRQFVPFYRLCFLSVYRTFVTPSELLLLLIQRYEKIKSEMDGLDDITEHLKTLKSLLSFVKLWIDKCPRDFTDLLTPSETHQLEEFLTSQIALFPETVHDVATLQRQLATPTRSEQTTCKTCNHYRCDGSDRQYDWLGMSPIQVAKDLTSLDAEIFRSIVPHQCLHYVRNQRHLSSTVSHSIDTFNNLVGVILYTIIHATNSSGQKTPSARGRAISHWIDVAQCCRQLKNFSSLKAIISGLDSSSIFRLKTSWKKIPK